MEWDHSNRLVIGIQQSSQFQGSELLQFHCGGTTQHKISTEHMRRWRNRKSLPNTEQLGIQSVETPVAGTTGRRLGKAPVDGHKGLLDKDNYNESCANGYDIPTVDHNTQAEACISCKWMDEVSESRNKYTNVFNLLFTIWLFSDPIVPSCQSTAYPVESP